MSSVGQHLTLVMPGLCGSGVGFFESLTERFHALERLLSRSRQQRRDVNNLDSSLCSHFGLHYPPGTAIPVAALTSLVDIDEPGSGYIMRADPVHLRADQSVLRLFDSRTFSIAQDEADALAAAFNELYSDKPWRLVAACPQRWYLFLPDEPYIATVSPASIASQDIDSNLPHGRDATKWHAVMNEVQMLFHQHPVNARREERGEPAINSPWFWGEGRLPEHVPRTDFRVATDDPLGMGLATLTRTPRRDVPVDPDELLADEESSQVLVVLDELDAAMQYTEIETWLETMRRYEQNWFVPLLDALGKGRLTSLEIDPCSGKTYRTTRKQQRYFWKRARPLATVCQHG